MKAVILGAGKSTRTYPLTATKPKPLLPVMNKTIIEHNLEKLVGLVDEVVLVVGYKQEMIREHLGDSFQGLKLSYVIQEEQNGTGGAILAAKELLDQDSFLVINGDDLFAKEDIEKCIQHSASVLVKEVDDLHRFGEVIEKNGVLTEIIEKPEKKKGLANTGLYVFPAKIFNHKLELSPRGEYEITDFLNMIGDVKVEKVEKYWLPISYSWNILDAQEVLLENIESDIQGEIEDGVTLKGEVIIGEGTVVKSGAYIEGPVIIGRDCVIGPNCYIRSGTCVGDGSKIGNAVDVKNVSIGKNTNIAHLAYVGDSVLGDNVNVAAGVVTANLRHDKKNISSPVKGKMTDTGRRKLGAIIADDVKLGINNSIYPGRKIWPGAMTSPGQVIDKDIEA